MARSNKMVFIALMVLLAMATTTFLMFMFSENMRVKEEINNIRSVNVLANIVRSSGRDSVFIINDDSLTIEDGEVTTTIREVDGEIIQESSIEGYEGEQVPLLSSDSFSVSVNDGLISFSTDYGEVDVAIRNGEAHEE